MSRPAMMAAEDDCANDSGWRDGPVELQDSFDLPTAAAGRQPTPSPYPGTRLTVPLPHDRHDRGLSTGGAAGI